MVSRPLKLLFAAGCLAASVLLLPSALAATTLFSDDFGAKPLGSWTPSPLGLLSHWSGAAGTAAYDGGGHTQLWAGSGSWTDYTFESKFRLANGSNYPGGIRGRVDLTTGAGYAAWIYPGDGVIKLWRSTAWHIDTPKRCHPIRPSVARLLRMMRVTQPRTGRRGCQAKREERPTARRRSPPPASRQPPCS